MAEDVKDGTPSRDSAGAAAPATSAPAWIEENQSLAVKVAAALIFLYVSPVFLIGLAALQSDGFQESSFAYSWFAAFMKTSDTTLNQFHKVLFPILSTISVLAFRAKPTMSFLAVGVFVLFSFVVSVCVGVLFDMSSIQLALGGLPDALNLELTRAFFTRVQETLLMYLGTMLGLGITNAAKAGSAGA